MGFKPGQVITDASLNARDMTGQVVFQAIRASVLSLANDTLTAITLDTPAIDTLGAYSAGAPTLFTPTVAGWYICAGVVGYASNATGFRYAGFIKNGTLDVTSVVNTVSTTVAVVPTPTKAIYCNGTTDNIALGGRQNSGGALNTATGAAQPAITIVYAGA